MFHPVSTPYQLRINAVSRLYQVRIKWQTTGWQLLGSLGVGLGLEGLEGLEKLEGLEGLEGLGELGGAWGAGKKSMTTQYYYNRERFLLKPVNCL